MKYDIKFKGTEEQIQKIVEILVGQGVQWGDVRGNTLMVYTSGVRDGVPYMQSLNNTYDEHHFKEVDPTGFIDAHSDMPGNPWVVANGTEPGSGEADLQVLMFGELDNHSYIRLSVKDSAGKWDWEAEGSLKILKWRFANVEDARKYYAKHEGKKISATRMTELINSQPRPFKDAATPRNKYSREIAPGVWVDVYDVLAAFVVTDPCLQHLVKKALAVGQRGHKDAAEDYKDIYDSSARALERYELWNAN